MDKQTAALLAVQKAVLEELRIRHDELRARVSDEMRPGDAAAAMTGDQSVTLGRVRMDKPREAWRVHDQAALVEWLGAHMPEQLETITITQARPAFVKAICDAKGRLSERINEATGEVIPAVPVPGVGCTVAARGVLNVTVTDDARALARVMVGGLPELMAGSGNEVES